MANNSLLPIGAFSSATQLSAKALRLYAEHGILTPAKVDSDTGYRYYRPEQVRDARLVRLLRDLDMPLTDIAALLERPASIEGALKRHMESLAQRHARQQTTYHATLALLRSITQTTPMSIIERHMPAMDALALPFDADSRTMLVRATALSASLPLKCGMQLPDAAMTFIPLNSALSPHDDTSLELCIPIEALNAIPENHVTRHWPSQSLVCADVSMVDGMLDLVGAADALFDWFDRNGASLRETPRLLLSLQAAQLAWPISPKEI